MTQAKPEWISLRPGEYGLRSLNSLTTIYALAWRQRSPHLEDEWSTLFLQFKSGNLQAFRIVEFLLRHCLPEIVPLTSSCRIQLVTALRADRNTADSQSPLHRVATALSRAIDRCVYRPELLRKRIHKRLHQIPDLPTRINEIGGVYECLPQALESTVTNFLILDDFVTSGSTLDDIARAIRIQYPDAPICAAALCKNVFWDLLADGLPPGGTATSNNQERLSSVLAWKGILEKNHV